VKQYNPQIIPKRMKVMNIPPTSVGITGPRIIGEAPSTISEIIKYVNIHFPQPEDFKISGS